MVILVRVGLIWVFSTIKIHTDAVRNLIMQVNIG